MIKKLDSKKVVKRIWQNAAISLFFSSFILFLILSFAELAFSVQHWSPISRGLLGLGVFVDGVYSLTHASGLINAHRRQMEEWKRQYEAEKDEVLL